MKNKKLFKFIYWLITSFLMVLMISFIFIIKDDISSQKIISLILMLIVSLLAIVFIIIVSIYVYRDAKKRNMNEWMWITIAVYTPNLLGIILYLLARKSVQYSCFNCGKQLEMDFLVCPYCGYKIEKKSNI